MTLDDAGNIYVAATSVYGTHKSGLLGGGGGPGDIYKLDANTGSATRLVATDVTAHTYVAGSNQMPNTGPGLGNIHYSCEYKRLYVTNFEDGMIYCIDPTNGVFQGLAPWNHGASVGITDTDNASNSTAPWTQLGRRVWGLTVGKARCYYSVWKEDQLTASATAANEIWSVGLDGSGNFTGLPRLEVSVSPPVTPFIQGKIFSSPISDISFSTTGKMLLAERSMAGIIPSAHYSRVLEYVWQLGNWTASTAIFKVGFHQTKDNAAGGCDYGAPANQRVWMTGDFLTPSSANPPKPVYGLQGAPDSGGTYLNSILIDLDGVLTIDDKKHIGDVEIPCPPPQPCSAVVKEIMCKKGDGAGYTLSLEVTNNSGQPAIDVLLATEPGSSHTVTPGRGGPVADHASITIPVTITGGKPGTEACFTVTLMGEDGCLCTVEVCPVLPDCCAILENEGTEVKCNKDGTYTYTTTITNNSGSSKQFIYLYPQAGVTMTPDHFTMPAGGLADGGVFQTPPITISGANAGKFCFNISLHNKGMEGCCLSPHHCITLLPCDIQPTRSR